MDKLKSIWGEQKLLVILVLLPVIFMAGLILLKAVNVPYYDQWEFEPIIHHVKDGHFYFYDLWHLHNEHRIFFPRIVMLTSAILTKWNLEAENWIGFVIACGSFVLILKTFKQTTEKLKDKIVFLAPVLLSVIWFSPVQFENWLWGWQIQWFLSVLGIVMVALGIVRIKGRELSYPDLLLMLSGGVLASYSLGNGVIIWPILILVLLYTRVSLLKTAIAAVTGAITTGLYYYHYVSPTPSSPSEILKEPVLFAKYVLAYLGRPLSFFHKLAPIMGLCLLIIFFGLNLYLLIRKRKIFDAVLPLTAMGLYAIASSMATAMSRMGLGLGQAYTSRYTTISSLLLVATVVICVESRGIFKVWFKGLYRPIAFFVTIAVFGLVLLNVAWGIHGSNIRSRELTDSKACTHTAQPSQACLLYAYPNAEVVQGRLDYLKQIHWGGY